MPQERFNPAVSRRKLLQAGIFAGTAAFLAACGAGSAETQKPSPLSSPTTGPSKEPTASPLLKPSIAPTQEVLAAATEKPKEELTFQFVATTANQVIKDYDGKHRDFDKNGENWCEDIVQELNSRLGFRFLEGKYAYQIFGQYPNSYEAIDWPKNSALDPSASLSPEETFTALIGDVFVWEDGYNGIGGHTGFATGTQGVNENGPWYEIFEQNDPLGSVCHKKVYSGHDLLSLRGVMRPVTIDGPDTGSVYGPGTTAIAATQAPEATPNASEQGYNGNDPVEFLDFFIKRSERVKDFETGAQLLALKTLYEILNTPHAQQDANKQYYLSSKITQISGYPAEQPGLYNIVNNLAFGGDTGGFDFVVEYTYGDVGYGTKLSGEALVKNLKDANRYARIPNQPEGKVVDYWGIKGFEWDEFEHGLLERLNINSSVTPSKEDFRTWFTRKTDKSQFPPYSTASYHREVQMLISRVDGKWYVDFNPQPSDSYDTTREINAIFPQEKNEYKQIGVDGSLIK